MSMLFARVEHPVTASEMADRYPQYTKNAWHKWLSRMWCERKFVRVVVDRSKVGSQPIHGYKYEDKTK